jgi:hypothetical protein
VKPHKVRYYLARRDPDFTEKMAKALCVYRQVKLLKKKPPSVAVAIVSYDEKPGVQAIGTTAPDLPPEPGRHQTVARGHEYKRQGTLSLLAGIDLLTGKVHALVKDRPRSREFVEFLKLLDAAYPAPAPCSATSASPPSRNSRTASRSLSTTSIAIPSSTPGPTSSTAPPDKIRSSETMDELPGENHLA